MSLNLVIIYAIMGAMAAFIIGVAIKSLVTRHKLHQSGDLVQGCIIVHRDAFNMGMEDRGTILPQREYFLTFSFEYQGVSYTQEKKVSKETYRAFSDGDSIRVRCLPGHPVFSDAVDL